MLNDIILFWPVKVLINLKKMLKPIALVIVIFATHIEILDSTLQSSGSIENEFSARNTKYKYHETTENQDYIRGTRYQKI